MSDDLQLLQSLFTGCLSVTETTEGVAPVRFTERQLSVYARNEAQSLRSRCLAGCRLEMRTDSEYIRFDYVRKGGARKYIYFDIWVDGRWVANIGEDDPERPEGSFSYEISGNKGAVKQICIDLPHNAEIVFRSFQLSPGALCEPVGQAPGGLLCLGDSITQGMDAKHPSSTYPALLARAFDLPLINQGVGGYIFNADSLDENVPFEPQIVTVAYGTNDWVRHETMAQFRDKCAAYIEAVSRQYAYARIFVITPIWRRIRNESKPLGTFDELVRTIKEICAEYPSIHVIDGESLVAHYGRLFADGTHPTDEGFVHMALNLYKQMRNT
ncbi:SGNH/GDSL hydrolase family protein [Paenibacillus mesophilus]|uniref:SGNH/GDSL hydrolase family protein n=1 Tax=Paenibacillus mesophilus TaxID=2582849 RepID=UPI00110DAA71|nr:SGNH/GDSL hydrolase family protein [Paenibacillus mesophilus]TMV45261.1 SGNH/GDSL hydrolase family protein [Paenibacillus mesophilus]